MWLILGFLGGIVTTRNAEPMGAPATSAVFLAFVVGCGLLWFAGYRGKREAVATAVATAVASANAAAEASARSAATSAVTLYLGQQAGITPEMHEQIVDSSVKEIAAIQHVPAQSVSMEKEVSHG